MKKHFTIMIGIIMFVLILGLNAWTGCYGTNVDNSVKSSVIDLKQWDFDRSGPYNLSGYWEFYPSRIILHEDFIRNEKIGIKRFVEVPRAFYNQMSFRENYDSSYGTLRTTLKIPVQYIGKKMALRSTLFYMNAVVYVDGQEIVRNHEVSRLSSVSERITPNLMASFIPNQETVEVIVHFTQENGYSNAYGNILFGPSELIQNHLIKRLLIDTFLFSVMLILAIFNMGFFLRVNKRKSHEKIALYFVLLIAIMVIRLVNSGEHYLLYLLPMMPGELFSKLCYWSYYLLLPMFVLFACEVRKEMLPPTVRRISLYTMAFFGLVVLMTGQEIYLKLIPLYYLYFVLVLIQLVLHVIRAMRLQTAWLKAEFVAFACMVTVFILDSLYVVGYYEIRNYYLVSIFVFICYVTYMVSKSYSGAVDQLENLTFAYDQLELSSKNAEQQYARNLNEKQEVFESLIYQRDLRLTALEKIAKEYSGALVILDQELRIVSIYGLSAEKYFGNEYVGEKFTKYFFGEHSENGELFTDILMRVKQLDAPGRISTYLSLLPKVAFKQGRWYAFSTSMIHLPNSGESHYVISIEDMNKFMNMKQQLQQSQKLIKLLKAYAKYEKEIKYLIYRVSQFTQIEIDELIEKSETVDELIEGVILSLERFAVWFEAMGFEKTHEKYRNFVLELDRLQKEVVPVQMEELIHIIRSSKVEDFDAEDRKLLKEYVGTAVEISKEEIEHMSDQRQDVLEMLDIIRPYCEVLAERYGKTIDQIKLEGQSVAVSLSKMAPIVRVLSRVFDAIIVHNIEYYDERIKANKPVIGHITVRVERTLEHLLIVIEDDGAGINVNTLKDSLYKLNLLSFKDIINAADEEILPYIFEPGVNYRESDNDYYGIGDGLWKVKETLNAFGGTIEVASGYQQYCRFTVKLPIEEVCP